ncbi:hypothetical protein GXP67_14135 [Rhodocytophaga rosea]|uniref:Uncharacterized protein n=1 Tax=Rhodocytophaga rosea TaxID=2704465 RepID=A0A6C0GI65_9BACT|nr:hypothetical protein [Rhodocytophaga rosea]QHT67688.1 hypothetical protein GXP67_14135 [Rhodocytophaga rosea]
MIKNSSAKKDLPEFGAGKCRANICYEISFEIIACQSLRKIVIGNNYKLVMNLGNAAG